MSLESLLGQITMCVLQDDLEGAKEIARKVSISFETGEPIAEEPMSISKRLFEQVKDEKDYCEDCGGPGEVIVMGRRWCKECWEVFEREYSQYLKEEGLL